MEQDGQFWSVKPSNLSPENVSGARSTDLTFFISHSVNFLLQKSKDKQRFVLQILSCKLVTLLWDLLRNVLLQKHFEVLEMHFELLKTSPLKVIRVSPHSLMSSDDFICQPWLLALWLFTWKDQCYCSNAVTRKLVLIMFTDHKANITSGTYVELHNRKIMSQASIYGCLWFYWTF